MSDEFWVIVQDEQTEGFCWYVRTPDGGLERVHHRGENAQEIAAAVPERKQTQ